MDGCYELFKLQLTLFLDEEWMWWISIFDSPPVGSLESETIRSTRPARVVAIARLENPALASGMKDKIVQISTRTMAIATAKFECRLRCIIWLDDGGNVVNAGPAVPFESEEEKSRQIETSSLCSLHSDSYLTPTVRRCLKLPISCLYVDYFFRCA